MSKVFYLIFFLLIFTKVNFSNLHGQSIQIKTLNVKNGFPSNDVYCVKQDSKGFIWGTTNKGVVRYDGKKYKLFTVNDGLASNDNFSMLIDSKDNIWLYSFKAISKIEPSGYIKRFGNTKNYFHNFVIDKHDRIYCQVFDKQRLDENSAFFHFMLKNDSLINLQYTRHGTTFFKRGIYTMAKFNFITGENQWIEELDYSDLTFKKVNNVGFENFALKGANLQIEYHEINDEFAIIFGLRSYKVIYKNQITLQYDYPFGLKKITKQNLINTHNEVLITFNEGVYRCTPNELGQLQFTPIVMKENVSNILPDKDGNFWYSTIGEGLFMIPNFVIKNSIIKNKNLHKEIVTKIDGDGVNNIFCGTSNNGVGNLDGNLYYKSEIFQGINALKINKKSVYFCGNNAFYKDNRLINPQPIKALSIFRDSIAIATTFGINFLPIANPKIPVSPSSSQITDIRGRFYSVLLLSNLFYSGNQQGLFWGRPKKDELFPICLEDSDESVSVNGILEAADKNIWVSTEGKGVYVLKDKKVIRHFEKELLDGNIHSMKIDEQDQVWISTRKGINKIEKGPRDYKVKKYTSYHGLPSDYVYDTYCYQDILYAATDEGLVKIDMNELDKLNFGMPPPVYIMNATVQSKSTLLKLNTDTIGEFSSQQNTISFEYTGISYKSNGNISFEYRLLPTINKWVATTNDNITFNNLSAGDYSFEVVAINAIGIRSAKPAVYRFRIEKHFTATIWFITLCIGLIIGLIGWAIYKYLKYEKLKLGEKSQNEKVIAELTLKSLQAQLNPHFIFNSLNAIQQFINVENRKEANEYLARFARLMRLYLGGSENQFISLEQEMEVIKLYCQLEHLRFSDRFRYEINMDDSIDLKNVEVPAMLLQPHVENAIRHGLIPCDSDNNLLQINIYSVNDGVICAIKDNGIGRSQSFINKQGKENRHKSLGNKISKERLDAIRSLHLAYITEEISDVIVDGEIRGTCVEIYIRKKD
ncbi:MAG: histidine kinase [Saprospiraceae bacterium]|nr:histidine kinase [Saprospiraceae bacterium]